jgi:hypothetical protein
MELTEYDVAGEYLLGDARATVEASGDELFVRESETDPVTGARISGPRLRARPIGGGVYGYAGGPLMSHRLDFPRRDVARVGWLAMRRRA